MPEETAAAQTQQAETQPAPTADQTADAAKQAAEVVAAAVDGTGAAKEKPAEPETKAPVDAKAAEDARIQARRFAEIARKEKQLYKRESDMKRIEGELAEARKQLESVRDLETIAKTDPLSLLKRFGVSYESLTNQVLNSGQPTTDAQIAALRQEIENARKQSAEEIKRLQEEQKKELVAQQQAARERFETDLVDFVKSKADDYELINALNAQNVVLELIEKHYEQSKRIMSYKEAADLVEEHILKSVSAAKKLAGQSKAPEQAKQAQQSSAQSKPPPESKTISNDMSAGAMASSNAVRSDSERLARALAVLEGFKP